MLVPQFTILYVANPTRSALFYRELFGRQPVEESPTFVMFVFVFVFESGARLALWSSATVEPAVTQTAGAMELAFALPDNAAVDRLSAEWLARGLTLIQAPTKMEFGYTCMALDPDGHRLRLYCPAPELG
ncbi:VOC family protein [Aeromonas veronii]|uniref:VOC family protein n=1 Tax=Aeromonas veronii TaxID=654 RepID=UPI003B9ED36B